MNALFFFSGYDHRRNCWERFALTVPDGPDDRFARARAMLASDYPNLRNWSGWFLCLTAEEVFKELS